MPTHSHTAVRSRVSHALFIRTRVSHALFILTRVSHALFILTRVSHALFILTRVSHALFILTRVSGLLLRGIVERGVFISDRVGCQRRTEQGHTVDIRQRSL
jgi:hypothetical protein